LSDKPTVTAAQRLHHFVDALQYCDLCSESPTEREDEPNILCGECFATLKAAAETVAAAKTLMQRFKLREPLIGQHPVEVTMESTGKDAGYFAIVTAEGMTVRLVWRDGAIVDAKTEG
jgi:hypothetical protein